MALLSKASDQNLPEIATKVLPRVMLAAGQGVVHVAMGILEKKLFKSEGTVVDCTDVALGLPPAL